ncbi:MAG: hypothetical protein GX491_06910 [Chloroflexi bacterium]|nr:hypothetical protein [Chloroflexota bacterium]
MYKAVDCESGEEIIILDPFWRKRLAQLRELDRAGRLVCQGCRQELRVKAGPVKRWHFAHRHLKACSYGSESPAILSARAVLYSWLKAQFDPSRGREASVTLEKQLEGSGLPRPVDCWVETREGCFAYWIIEAGIKLEPREAIPAAFQRLGVKVHWIFLRSMLNEERREFHSVLLTPTERVFMQQTPMDAPLAGAMEPGMSLHYLDAAKEEMTTYRNLTLFHRPNWFRGTKRCAGLASLQIDPRSGEIIYPGEARRLGMYLRRQAKLAEKRLRYEERQKIQRPPFEMPDVGANETTGFTRLRERWNARPAGGPVRGQIDDEQRIEAGPEALPCIECGQITQDYWATFFDEKGRKLCRCRECLDRQLSSGN